MAEGFSSDDPFYNLEGKDGFHVVRVEQGDVVMLSCMAYQGGEPVSMGGDPEDGDLSVEILELFKPTGEALGAVNRLHLVLDAVARYLTTGGSWMEFEKALKLMRKIAVGGLRFPGYHLCTSYATSDGTYQHVFVKDGTTQAVLWEEPEIGEAGLPVGGWISPTTLEKIKEQQENDGQIWEERQGAEQTDSGLPRLSGRKDTPPT